MYLLWAFGIDFGWVVHWFVSIFPTNHDEILVTICCKWHLPINVYKQPGYFWFFYILNWIHSFFPIIHRIRISKHFLLRKKLWFWLVRVVVLYLVFVSVHCFWPFSIYVWMNISCLKLWAWIILTASFSLLLPMCSLHDRTQSTSRNTWFRLPEILPTGLAARKNHSCPLATWLFLSLMMYSGKSSVIAVRLVCPKRLYLLIESIVLVFFSKFERIGRSRMSD